MNKEFSDSKLLHLDFVAKEDHIERASRKLESLKAENRRLKEEIHSAQECPFILVKDFEDKILSQITSLRNENERLQNLLAQQNYPNFAELTNLTNAPELSYRSNEPELSYRSNHSEKYETTSTCLNASFSHEAQLKTNLQERVNQLHRESQELDSYLKSVNVPKSTHKNNPKIQKVAQYKKKLLNTLNDLRQKERNTTQLVQEYRKVYEDTMKKYREAEQELRNIIDIKISDDIDERYAIVLGLQQQLHRIENQLKNFQDKSWLREIIRELQNIVIDRMGLSASPCSNLQQYIDQLCDIVMESYLSSKRQSNQRNNLIRQYLDEEKQNNYKTILLLKNKEQILGKKLIQYQMKK